MDWGYIAGYFDGEGTATFHVGANGYRTKGLHWYNTHLESLEAMRTYMGVGRIGVRHHHSGFDGRKPAYDLSISNKADMLYAIDGMLPHLIIKRLRVETLRTFLVEQVRESRVANLGVLAALSDDELRTLYYDELLSYGAIADRYGVSPSAVAHQFKQRGFQARSTAGAPGRKLSEQTKARMRATKAQMWADPAVRDTQIAAMKAGRARTGYRMPKGVKKPTIQGEHHPRSKLTDAQTVEIRTRHAAGEGQRALARAYSVSDRTIHNIVHGLIRTNVPLVSTLAEPENAQLALIGD